MIRPQFRFSVLFLLALLFVTSKAVAQPPVDESDRDRILSEIRNYKHEMLAKALDLDKEKEKQFFEVYDEMDMRLMQISNETRDLERRVSADADASDTEIEAAAIAIYSQKEKEGKIELEYFDKFKEILTPRQLLRLKSAEREFTSNLVKQHHRMRSKQDRRK